MSRALHVAFAAALVAACAGARPAPTPPAPAAIEFGELPAALRADPGALRFPEPRFEPPEPRVERLPNGLVVYLLEDHTVPLVQVRALVRLGNVDDPPERVGLAQVAWLALQTGGAGGRGADAVDEALEDMAALIDGGVDDEDAELALEVRSADLEPGLGLFFDLLRRPRYEPVAVARVLAQARDAVERRRDDAGQVAQAAFMRAIWGEGSPFAREATLETLGRIGREDLLRLHAAAVVPGATRLVVTGDFDSARTLERLRALAGDWPTGPGLARKLPPPPALAPRQVLLVPTGGAQAKVRLGHLGPSRHDPREPALTLLDAVLGGTLGHSRLYSEIRDRRGLAYSVESMIAPGPAGGLVLVAADTRPEAAREVIARCLEVVEAARGSQPPSDEELAVARDAHLNAFAFRFDTAARAAQQRALFDLRGYPAGYLTAFRARLRAITPAEVATAAREVLHPAALQIVVVGDPRRIGDLSEFGPVRTVLGPPEETGE